MSDGELTPKPTEPATWTTEDSPTRQHAKALCIQGVPRGEICKRLNLKEYTYDTWAKRGDWFTLRAKIASPLTTHTKVTITHEPRVFALRDQLATKAAKLIAGIPEKCPKQPRGFKDTMAALAHAASACSLIEGWSDGPKAQVDLSFLSMPADEVIVSPPLATQDAPNSSANTSTWPKQALDTPTNTGVSGLHAQD